MSIVDSAIERVERLPEKTPSDAIAKQLEFASWVWLYGPSLAVGVAVEIATLQYQVDQESFGRILSEVRSHELIALRSLEKYAT